jgi:acetyltransferase-like isoleucine patch superfamily enzyme
MSVQIAGRQDHAIDEVGIPIARSTWVGDRSARGADSVHVGRDVWIGGHSTVLSGVRIGDGAVVGAGSVVTKDIPPFSIAVGVPARVMRMRFTSEVDRAKHLEALDDLSSHSFQRT